MNPRRGQSLRETAGDLDASSRAPAVGFFYGFPFGIILLAAACLVGLVQPGSPVLVGKVIASRGGRH